MRRKKKERRGGRARNIRTNINGLVGQGTLGRERSQRVKKMGNERECVVKTCGTNGWDESLVKKKASVNGKTTIHYNEKNDIRKEKEYQR